MRPLLEVLQLDFSYVADGDRGGLVLEGERFVLPAGTACSLLGSNMSGKTTFLKMISGHLRGADTVVRVDGEALWPFAPARARSLGVAGVHQHDPLFPELSIWENVKLGRPGGGLGWRGDREMQQKLREQLSRWSNAQIDDELRTLSGGPQVLVRTLRAVLWGYKVLLLDEPTTGLDPNVRRLFFDLLFSTLNRDRAVVFVSHIAAEHDTLARGAAQHGMTHEAVRLNSGHMEPAREGVG